MSHFTFFCAQSKNKLLAVVLCRMEDLQQKAQSKTRLSFPTYVYLCYCCYVTVNFQGKKRWCKIKMQERSAVRRSGFDAASFQRICVGFILQTPSLLAAC